MINVFVTVGTTPFDDLIEICDTTLDPAIFKCIAQISDLSRYKAKNIKTFAFDNNISAYFENADIIISHAGAGNVYSILESNKKAIFVPNNSLKDRHQEDICSYVKRNNYAEVFQLNSNVLLGNVLLRMQALSFSSYSNSDKETLPKEIFKILKSI